MPTDDDVDIDFNPSDKQRELVKELESYNVLTHEQICILIKNPASGKSIRVETLRRCFAEELEYGQKAFKKRLINKLFEIACGCEPEYDEEGNLIKEGKKPNIFMLTMLAEARLRNK